MTLCARLSLPLVTLHTASPNAREILDGVRDEVGSIPNMYAAMANAPGLFDAYLYSYTQFRQECSLTPLEQEVILWHYPLPMAVPTQWRCIAASPLPSSTRPQKS